MLKSWGDTQEAIITAVLFEFSHQDGYLEVIPFREYLPRLLSAAKRGYADSFTVFHCDIRLGWSLLYSAGRLRTTRSLASKSEKWRYICKTPEENRRFFSGDIRLRNTDHDKFEVGLIYCRAWRVKIKSTKVVFCQVIILQDCKEACKKNQWQVAYSKTVNPYFNSFLKCKNLSLIYSFSYFIHVRVDNNMHTSKK